MEKPEATFQDFVRGAWFGCLIGTAFLHLLITQSGPPTLYDIVLVWPRITRLLAVGAYIVWVDYFRSKEPLALTACLFLLLVAESSACASLPVSYKNDFGDLQGLLVMSFMCVLVLFPLTLLVGWPIFRLRRKMGFLTTLLLSPPAGALTGIWSATLLFGGMHKDVYLTYAFGLGGAITALACVIYVLLPSDALAATRLERLQRL